MLEVNIIYVLVFIIALALILILITSKHKISSNRYVYNIKELLTEWEINTLIEMRKHTPEEWIICPQARLADMLRINYKTEKEKYIYLNKVTSKSIDFIVTNERGLPILAVECDDKSHSKKDRIKRDNFINSIFDAIGIKLIRVKPYTETQWKQIFEDIKFSEDAKKIKTDNNIDRHATSARDFQVKNSPPPIP